MKKRTLLLALGLWSAMSAQAQTSTVPPHRTCSSFDHLQDQLAADPDMASRRQELENFTAQYIAKNPQAAKGTAVVYNIPVVVHVLYNNSTSNISDAQILSQIAVLNQDFQLLNADHSTVPSVFAGLKADCQINFCMAQRDPNGNPTTGIVRVSTTKSSFSTSSDNAKYTSSGGHDAWPRGSYLNIWVVPGIDGGGILGYAQFPGGNAATDGVVIAHQFFGTTGTATAPYNKGRTATHEVGHWLNLYHIWGDDGNSCSGSDQVGDTPNQGGENYGCPTFPKISCSNGPNGDLFMNYMDYVDDACMKMFSNGQKSRMHAVLSPGGSRASLASSMGCTPPSGTACNAPASQSAGSITSTSATISWAAVSGATSYILQWKATSSGTWTTISNISGTSYALSGLASGTGYDYKVATVCSGGQTSTYTATAVFTTLAAGGTCSAPTGLAMSSLTANTAIITWTAVSGAIAYTVDYRPTSSSTWISVTNLTSPTCTLTNLNAGTAYYIRFRTQCSTGYSSYTSTYSFTTTAASTCTNNYEPNNGKSSATSIAVNTTVQSMLGTNTDQDYFKVVTTSASPKLRVTLGSLPADYDLKLYNSAGALLATSQQGGTNSETVTYNNATAGATYYIRIYGYNGAYSASSCYSLATQTSATNFRAEAPGSDASKTALALYPNPSTGAVQLQYFASAAQDAQVDVLDQSGRLMWSGVQRLDEGANISSLNLGQLANGLYFVRLKADDEVHLTKLLIQH